MKIHHVAQNIREEVVSLQKELAVSKESLTESASKLVEVQLEIWKDLTEILDLVELSQSSSGSENPDPQKTNAILRKISRRFSRLLEKHHVQKVDLSDSEHLQVVDTETRPDLEHGAIIRLQRSGYLWNNRHLIRPAEVIANRQL